MLRPVLFAGGRSAGCGKAHAWRARAALVAAVVVQCNNIGVFRGIQDGLESILCIQVVSIGHKHPLRAGRTCPDCLICEVVQKRCKQSTVFYDFVKLVRGRKAHTRCKDSISLCQDSLYMQDDVLGLAFDLKTGDASVTMIICCPAAAIPGFILVTYMLSVHPYAIIFQVINKCWQPFERSAVCNNDERLPPE